MHSGTVVFHSKAIHVTFSYATQIYATADLLVNVTVKTRVHSNLKYNKGNINLQVV